MPRFRKKPVVIEAVQFNPEANPPGSSLLGFPVFYESPDNQNAYVSIETLEGTMKANPGDWIIKGVNGEYYPCKPDIFAKTYEPVPDGMGGSDLVACGEDEANIKEWTRRPAIKNLRGFVQPRLKSVWAEVPPGFTLYFEPDVMINHKTGETIVVNGCSFVPQVEQGTDIVPLYDLITHNRAALKNPHALGLDTTIDQRS